MKLAYLINQYPAPSHTFIRREIAALEALGLEVTRVSLRPPIGSPVEAADAREREITHVILGRGAASRMTGALVREAAIAPVRFARGVATAMGLARKSERGLVAQLAYLAEACVLKRLASKVGAGHVHAHFGTNPAAVALLCRILGGPTYSLTIHGPEEFDSPRALSLVEKVRGAAFVAAISEFTRSQLYRWSDPGDWPKIRVIRCGLDSSYLDLPPAPPPDPACRRFVCVGRLAEQKGHLVLLDAVARLVAEGRDLEVALVGDGPLRGEIERRVERSGLAGKVLLLGWRDDDGVRDEILKSRALVLPSFAEGLPVVLMEALALRRPAISTYVAGIPELIEPGVNGWLVHPGSVEALAHAMAECLDAPADLLARMGREGSVKAMGQHDASAEASRLADLLGLARTGDTLENTTPAGGREARTSRKSIAPLHADRHVDTV